MNKLLLILFLISSILISKKLEKVSLQLHWKYQFESAGFIVAKEKGFYKEKGLDVEIKEFKNGMDIEKNVLEGKSTYGVYSSSVFLSYLKGKPIRLLASFFKRSAAILVVKPNVHSPKDLINKKIMVGSKKDFNLRFKHMFEISGVSTDKLIFVKQSYNVNDFINNKVQAISAFISDEPLKLDELKIKYRILNPDDYGVFNLLLELFTSKSEANKHPQRTKVFKDASIKGWEYALSHKEEVVKLIHEKYRPDLSIEDLDEESRKIEQLILPYAYEVGSIDMNFLKKQYELFIKYYSIKNNINIKNFIFKIKTTEDTSKFNFKQFKKLMILIFIILLFIFQRQFVLKKHNQNLKKINNQLQLKKIELSNQSNKINRLNETLENRIKEEVEKNREMDKQMIQQARLAQMGEMISMIAHQWRQPLSAISNTAGALNIKAQLNKVTDEQIIEYTNKIQNYTVHLSSTIDDFRNFFKPNKEMELTNYNEIIDSVLSIIESSIKNKKIKIIKKLNSKISFITYRNEVKQVILNLIKNAEDILIEKKIIEPLIIISTRDEDNKHILEISDNGGGISNDIIEKIFDPYFSTKNSKNGTGLGLYMSKIIIEEHCNGEIYVKNITNDDKYKKNENEYFMIRGVEKTSAIFTIKLKG